MKSRNVSVLTDEKRTSLLQLPDDISDRLLARYLLSESFELVSDNCNVLNSGSD